MTAVHAAAAFSASRIGRRRGILEVGGRHYGRVDPALISMSRHLLPAGTHARGEPRGTEPFVGGERLKDCKLLCAVGSNCRRFVGVDIERSRNPHILMVVSAHATE
ncbi:MAG: hypothetical protein OEP48_02200 [Betaproteobacteria bacterium]|nr:hypothetical protein [Betaproteobacteria bacterium]MDH3438415.1 hypothetical protein [Betaproteobacteria bacterium]